MRVRNSVRSTRLRSRTRIRSPKPSTQTHMSIYTASRSTIVRSAMRARGSSLCTSALTSRIGDIAYSPPQSGSGLRGSSGRGLCTPPLRAEQHQHRRARAGEEVSRQHRARQHSHPQPLPSSQIHSTCTASSTRMVRSALCARRSSLHASALTSRRDAGDSPPQSGSGLRGS